MQLNRYAYPSLDSAKFDPKNPPRDYQYGQTTYLLKSWKKRLAWISRNLPKHSPVLRAGLRGELSGWKKKFVPWLEMMTERHLRLDSEEPDARAGKKKGLIDGFKLEGAEKDVVLMALWRQANVIDVSLGQIEIIVLAAVRAEKESRREDF